MKVKMLYQPGIKFSGLNKRDDRIILLNKVNFWNLINELKLHKELPIIFSIPLKIGEKTFEIGINTNNLYFLFDIVSGFDFHDENRLFFNINDPKEFVNKFNKIYEKFISGKAYKTDIHKVSDVKYNIFISSSNIFSHIFDKEGFEHLKKNLLKNIKGYNKIFFDSCYEGILDFSGIKDYHFISTEHIYYGKKVDNKKNMLLTVYSDLNYNPGITSAFSNKLDKVNSINQQNGKNEIVKEDIFSISYNGFEITTPIYDETNFKFDDYFKKNLYKEYKNKDFDEKEIIYFRYITLKNLYNHLEKYIDKKNISEEQLKELKDNLYKLIINFTYKDIEPHITDEIKGNTNKLEELILSKNMNNSFFKNIVENYNFDIKIYDKTLSVKQYIEMYEIEFFVLYLQGYVGYLLITADFCQWCEKEQIIVGPGRGSAGGSLLVFLSGITNIDPLPFDLLFYRFLNPNRVSPPDIDLDFEDIKRELAITYCQKKYGYENTCKIGTYTQYQFKNTFKSLCKFLGIQFSIANRLTEKLMDFKDNLEDIFGFVIEAEQENEDEDNDISDEQIEETDININELKKEIVLINPELEGKVKVVIQDLIDSADLKYINDEIKELLVTVVLALPYMYKQIIGGGIHACGVIISPKDVLPYYKKFFSNWGNDTKRLYKEKFKEDPNQANIAVSMLSGFELEDQGYLKFDFLGLKNLSIIGQVGEELGIKNTREWVTDIIFNKVQDNDVYEHIFSTGLTTGVFQFESNGMKKYLKELKPDNIEDLIAMVSLYRPGPMQFIPNYINRKNGLEEIKVFDEDIEAEIKERYGEEEYLKQKKNIESVYEKIAKNTYYVIIYQEQLMFLSQYFAGFNMAEADELRRIIGKKKIEKIPYIKEKFIKGAMEKEGYKKEVAEWVFEKVIEPAASYSFNKSHAACYALIAYINGYLKHYYPLYFYTALIENNIKEVKDKKKNKLLLVLQELYVSKNINIKIKVPSLKELDFKTFYNEKEKTIYLGGQVLKNLSTNFIEENNKKKNDVKTIEDIFALYDKFSKKDIMALATNIHFWKEGFFSNKQIEKKYNNFIDRVIEKLSINKSKRELIYNMIVNKVFFENSKEIIDELNKQKKITDKFLKGQQTQSLFGPIKSLIKEENSIQAKSLYIHLERFINQNKDITKDFMKKIIKEDINLALNSNNYDVQLLDKIEIIFDMYNIDLKEHNIMSLQEIDEEIETKNLRNVEEKHFFKTLVLPIDIATVDKGTNFSVVYTDIFLSKKFIRKYWKQKEQIELFSSFKENKNNLFFAWVNQKGNISYMEEI